MVKYACFSKVMTHLHIRLLEQLSKTNVIECDMSSEAKGHRPFHRDAEKYHIFSAPI